MSPANAPTCCPDGWHRVFAWWRFTTEPEGRYVPTTGKWLVVTRTLHNTWMFVWRYKELIVVTDDKPLLGILSERDIKNKTNPRLQSLKEKFLQYQSTVQHRPGKCRRGADSVTEHPCKHHISFLHLTCTNLSTNNSMRLYVTIHSIDNDTLYDTQYESLIYQILSKGSQK